MLRRFVPSHPRDPARRLRAGIKPLRPNSTRRRAPIRHPRVGAHGTVTIALARVNRHQPHVFRASALSISHFQLPAHRLRHGRASAIDEWRRRSRARSGATGSSTRTARWPRPIASETTHCGTTARQSPPRLCLHIGSTPIRSIPTRPRGAMRWMTGVTAQDDRTLTVTFSEPYAFANLLGMTDLAPLPRHQLGGEVHNEQGSVQPRRGMDVLLSGPHSASSDGTPIWDRGTRSWEIPAHPTSTPSISASSPTRTRIWLTCWPERSTTHHPQRSGRRGWSPAISG